jgi:hypothetical protein
LAKALGLPAANMGSETGAEVFTKGQHSLGQALGNVGHTVTHGLPPKSPERLFTAERKPQGSTFFMKHIDGRGFTVDQRAVQVEEDCVKTGVGGEHGGYCRGAQPVTGSSCQARRRIVAAEQKHCPLQTPQVVVA